MVDLTTLDADLAAAEAQVPRLRPGCEKQVIWAGDPGAQTEIAVVFVHGFSASCGELRPLPDLVAAELGANLYFTRLNGHGQDGKAMGEATFAAWQADIAETLDIAGALGRRVLVIACSTGCTLTALALADGAQVAGFVQVSPNYGLSHPVAQTLLDLPYVEKWGHFIAGKHREFPVVSPDHAKYWTTRYPSKAAFPMAEAVRAARAADFSTITTPTLALYNPADQVVSAKATEQALGRWGAPVTLHKLTQTPDDHDMGHIMAGDVFSPGQTAPMVARIVDWFRAL